MLLAGLTGGIGSGKSTVAEGLVARGAMLVDADVVAREVVRPGGPAYAAVVARFGPSVVSGDGTLDRAALAEVVFADPVARQDLNRITHPIIGAEMAARVKALRSFDGVVVLDVPLLDAGLVASYGLDAVVVVDLPEEVAVARLKAQRGFSDSAARARVATQIGREQRRGLIDLVGVAAVIDNRGDRASLETRIEEVWHLLHDAAARSDQR